VKFQNTGNWNPPRAKSQADIIAEVITKLQSLSPTPVVFSEAAVERAAKELWDGADPDMEWERISEYLKERTRERALAVLAAAVKEGQ
jgi:hypothetical protein